MEKTQEIITSIERFTLVKNICLIRRDCLTAEEVTGTYELQKTKGTGRVLARKKIDEISKPLCFDLRKITKEEIEDIRKARIPSFVLKEGDTLYYAQIPDNISFVSSVILGDHKCGVPCQRLSPNSDERGGCAKVRNRSTRIERYPWITLGFETFNTRHDSLVVAECKHYSMELPKPKPKKKNKNKDDFVSYC